MERSQVSFFLISLHILMIQGNIHQKCCGFGEQIIEKNGKFTCEKLKNARLQENFENKGFLGKNVSGTCVDIVAEKNVTLFKLRDTKIIEKLDEFGELFFPKCCPLDHSYNTTTHGCAKKAGSILNMLKIDSFVRVGLPDCEIISDKIIDSMQEVKMNGKDLVLLNEKRILKEDYCVDSTLDGKLAVRICEDDIQICSQIMCIHKCCPDGQSFINGSFCHDTFTHGVDLHFTKTILAPDNPFVLIHGFRPKIHSLSENKYNYHVDRFGVFSAYMNKSNSFDHYEVYNRSYCVEYAFVEKKNKVTMDEYRMFAQSKDPPLPMKFVITRWIKIVSCIFLILTILVYLLLPKMRNLFGKILLNYCVSTLIFFASLAISQFYSKFDDTMCATMGFISVLSSIWSFTWLHIMCIDIWFSFGTPRTLSGPLQKKEWKRLLQYSLYGWGFPICWVLMIALFSATSFMPEAMHPYIGKKKCYLENSDGRPGNYSYIIYVTLPLLIQQIVNTVLFIKTISYCLRIKAEIERMNDSEKRTALNASKERLGLIMKLAVIMGVLFIFETVSSIHNFQENIVTTYIEVVWDSINCLQGVFIFIIFICKKKVYHNICEKIPILKSRKTSVSSNATTQVSMHNISGMKN